MASRQQQQSPITLRGYTLLPKVIGSGGYGQVFKGFKTNEPNVQVAVKMISLQKVKLAVVQREVDVVTILHHKNIVNTMDGFQHGSRYYIVQELINGGELFERLISSTKFSESQALYYFVQLILAVNHCHENGIIHRDIKLENILVQDEPDSNETLKLCDFGLAAILPRHQDGSLDSGAFINGVAGSRSYLAPEVFAREGYRGPPADIWSSGVCLFAMLSGFFPFDEATARDWRFTKAKRAYALGHSLTRTIYGFYNKQCDLSDNAVELLDGMLAIDPTKRFGMSDIFRSDFVRPALEHLQAQAPLVALTQQDSIASLSSSEADSEDTFRSVSMSDTLKQQALLVNPAANNATTTSTGTNMNATTNSNGVGVNSTINAVPNDTDVNATTESKVEANSAARTKCKDISSDLVDCITYDEQNKFRDMPLYFLTNAMAYFGMDPWEKPVYRGGIGGEYNENFADDSFDQHFSQTEHGFGPQDLVPPLPRRQAAFAQDELSF